MQCGTRNDLLTDSLTAGSRLHLNPDSGTSGRKAKSFPRPCLPKIVNKSIFLYTFLFPQFPLECRDLGVELHKGLGMQLSGQQLPRIHQTLGMISSTTEGQCECREKRTLNNKQTNKNNTFLWSPVYHNPSTWLDEIGRIQDQPGLQGQPGLNDETLPNKHQH